MKLFLLISPFFISGIIFPLIFMSSLDYIQRSIAVYACAIPLGILFIIGLILSWFDFKHPSKYKIGKGIICFSLFVFILLSTYFYISLKNRNMDVKTKVKIDQKETVDKVKQINNDLQHRSK
jgi:NADH:ubiquinone oxidoreductase subunit 6 (subunit J)